MSPAIISWARPRYAAYRAGQVPEEVMCGEMVTMHRGLKEEKVQQACDTYFAQSIAPNIFPEMRQLIERLRASQCDIWAVSSSNQWIIRSGMRYFGIPDNRILAAEVAIHNGVITDRLIRVPSGPGKTEAIRSVLQIPLPIAPSETPSGIAKCWPCQNMHSPSIPNPDLKEIAIANSWRIYQPEIN